MRLFVVTTMTLALSGGIALAQSSGGASSGGASSSGAAPGGAPSAAAPASPGVAPGPTAPGAPEATPALNPGAAPATVPRANNEVNPPTRLLPQTAPRATAPGGEAQTGEGSGSARTPPGAPDTRRQQPGATESGGSRLQSGAAGSAQTNAKRTGKNALNQEYADCMRLWDAKTHMSKQDWSRTCRRIQSRLDQPQIK